MHRAALGFCLICLHTIASDPYPKNEAIDILHYTFTIELNDTTDVIAGKCELSLRTKQRTNQFRLNLSSKGADGTGMQVFEVTLSGKPVTFMHKADLLEIFLSPGSASNDTLALSITYAGIPTDGLVIGKNKFGDRTFFGDNWPDRGHNWLPSIDHPYDKAKVDFIVRAPNHYRVIATGQLVGEREVTRSPASPAGRRKEWHWKEQVDVPVKVMTIGVARFSVEQSGMVGSIPVTTWVFPQNEKAGFRDFAVAPKVLSYLQDFVGPYPYEKLAHVQSKTRWGGLENASNIFYFENSVNGKKERDGLIAHETAHQWFGNSVTESDWHHVWLSEGFATYFAALYLGSAYGDERFKKEMKESRTAVIEYTKKNKALIIDTTIVDIGQVLSTSTYQKAAWVLHMLRTKVGDEPFKAGIRAYYAKYRDANATTAGFISIMEETTGQELGEFLRTWLYQPGHPVVSGTWSYDPATKDLKIDLVVTGFNLPNGQVFDIAVVSPSGKKNIIKWPVTSSGGRLAAAFQLTAPEKPAAIVLDPNVTMLFEGEIKEKR